MSIRVAVWPCGRLLCSQHASVRTPASPQQAARREKLQRELAEIKSEAEVSGGGL